MTGWKSANQSYWWHCCCWSNCYCRQYEKSPALILVGLLLSLLSLLLLVQSRTDAGSELSRGRHPCSLVGSSQGVRLKGCWYRYVGCRCWSGWCWCCYCYCSTEEKKSNQAGSWWIHKFRDDAWQWQEKGGGGVCSLSLSRALNHRYKAGMVCTEGERE